MQEYQNDLLVKTEPLLQTEKLKDEVKHLIVPAMKKDSTHQVIGKIPEVNQCFVLNGLRYKVTRSDFARGKIIAKIIKPNNIGGSDEVYRKRR